MTNKVNIYSRSHKFSHLLLNKYLESGVAAEIFSDSNIYETIENNSLSSTYSIFIFDQISGLGGTEKSDLAQKYINIARGSYKSLFLFPYTNPPEIYEASRFLVNKIYKDRDINAGIIYLGDPIDETGDLVFTSIKGYLDNGHSFSNTITNIYPTDAGWAANALVRLTFSMKAYGETTALIGQEFKIPSSLSNGLLEQKSSETLISAKCTQLEACPLRVKLDLTKVLNDINSQPKNEPKLLKSFLQTPDGSGAISVNQKSKGGFVSTVLDSLVIKFGNRKKQKVDKVVVLGPTKLFKLSVLLKRLFIYSLIFCVLFLATPFIFYAASYSLIKFSYNQLLNLNPYLNEKISKVGDVLAEKSFSFSENNKKLVIVSGIYERQSARSRTLKDISSNIKFFHKTNLSLLELFNNSLGTNDKWEGFRDIATNFDYLENSLGFLQADGNSLGFFDEDSLFGINKIDKTRESLKSLKKISNLLPEIMGSDGIRRYIVAVGDDNMLRGSGGKISAVGILEISGGNVNDFIIYDIEDVAGNLKGTVEPPGGFVENFDSKDWSLEQANWYSDFSLSADRMIWFIDKGLQLKTDGVFYLSSSAISKVVQSYNSNIDIIPDIKLVGDNDDAIRLADFYKTLTNRDNYSNNSLMSDIYYMFRTKQLMLYSTIPEVQEALRSLETTGEVKVHKNCGADCFTDIFGYAEIYKTRGGNNVQREVNVSVSLEEGIIKKRLTIFIKNLNDFDYEAVFRVFSSLDSGFSPVSVVSGNQKKDIDGFVSAHNGIKQNEIDVKVVAGETAGIGFHWELNDKNSDKYIIRYLKQSGISDYDLNLVMNSESKLTTAESGFSLTNGNQLVYNTKLSTDLTLEIVRK